MLYKNSDLTFYNDVLESVRIKDGVDFSFLSFFIDSWLKFKQRYPDENPKNLRKLSYKHFKNYYFNFDFSSDFKRPQKNYYYGPEIPLSLPLERISDSSLIIFFPRSNDLFLKNYAKQLFMKNPAESMVVSRRWRSFYGKNFEKNLNTRLSILLERNLTTEDIKRQFQDIFEFLVDSYPNTFPERNTVKVFKN